MEMVTRRAPLR
ncbi:hypothetical protein M6B38_199535 [Iris pallida]|uniref:Uncharacterized protein n=1 Tax=Iris pallida TaxID=29817 RepID=A0AAX6EAV9_IRIPA|nr:hypothetical protein M6B38_199535 [Iris pallida]